MGREPKVWVLTFCTIPQGGPFPSAFPPRVTSQGGPGCWQHRRDLCAVRIFHNLFLQFFFVFFFFGNTVVYLYKY